MKTQNKNYLQMPKGLLTKYNLSAGGLYLYYTLKEYEERFCNKDNPFTFRVTDDDLRILSGMGHNQITKYKAELKKKNLIRARRTKEGKTEYLLYYLYNEGYDPKKEK